MRTSLYIFLTDIMNLFMGAISFFILARVILKLFAANPATPFVSFVYNVSGAIISPFASIFQEPLINGVVVDLPAIFSLVVYAIIFYLLAALIDTFAATSATEDEHAHIHGH